jgi:crossover junction endodeoxyribonuclease RuvC
MTASCVLGVDPGLSGALAFYFPTAADRIASEDLPIAGGLIDAANLAARIEQMRPDFAIVERVGAMPKQGLASTFRFGQSCGAIIGVISVLKIPIHFAAPTKWKRFYGLGSDKEEARSLAIRLFPACASQFSRKKDHNRAEASLLALYAARVIGGAS